MQQFRHYNCQVYISILLRIIKYFLMLRILRKKKDDASIPGKQQAVVLPLHSPSRSLEFFTELIDKIRPENPKDIQQAELKLRHCFTK